MRVRLFAVLAMLCATPAHAQSLDADLPASVPGFDAQRGVTVLSRLRPLYDDPGVHAGDWLVRPTLDAATGFDSNVAGQASSPASLLLRTAAGLSANTLWQRDRLGLALGLSQDVYPEAARENRTNGTVAIGTGLANGQDMVDLGYSHLWLDQDPTDIGQLRADAPIGYQVDDARADYRATIGPYEITPNVDLRRYGFDRARIAGTSQSQAYRDRDVLAGGVAIRDDLTDQAGLLLVLRGEAASYATPVAGQPSRDQDSLIALAGLDDQEDGPWRYQLLAGVERRSFRAAAFRAQTAPLVEAKAFYTPTGLTTLTASVSRAIADAASEGARSTAYTDLRLVIDHEYLRDVLLQGRAGFAAATDAGLGTQVSGTVGAGITWLLNRHMRLSLDYDHTAQSRGLPLRVGAATITAPALDRDRVLLALHLGD